MAVAALQAGKNVYCEKPVGVTPAQVRAVIAADGTVQSLEAVAGDPMFFASAMEAVRQWRYTPTVLNGQRVEVDTYITVIYNMQR